MSDNGLPYYKAYPRDFIEGTIGMTFEEKGAYRLILDMIYMRNGALIDDDAYIAGVLNISKRKWTSLKNRLIELGKIEVIDGLILNYRAIIELEKTRYLQDKNAENGSKTNKNSNLKKRSLNHTDTDTYKKDISKDISKKDLDFSSMIEIVGEEAATDFVAMRKSIRKPITTQRTIDRLASKLRSFDDPVAAIQQSIDNSWQGVFQPKQSSNSNRMSALSESEVARIAALARFN